MYTAYKFLQDLKDDLQQYEEKENSSCKSSFLHRVAVMLKSPAFFATFIFRFGCCIDETFKDKNSRFPKILLKCIYHLFKYLITISTKISISSTSIIDGGIYISNEGNCIIGVGRIGKNCIIGHSTTIGVDKKNIPPIIGNNVVIGSRCLVYGSIIIGDNVVIEDDTVLSKSVSAGARVKGNPAKVIL
ncbi:MAG: hypothetical protein JXB49_30140 [Bacteroidales bacterium]|nr:hypothetical protein [Bacteroidales bacterium]